MENHSKELLLAEFHEAWEHYRHLENGRAKYLGFFFTILFAIVGFIVSIINKEGGIKEIEHTIWFGLILLVWVLNVLTTFIYTTVKKVKAVLLHYEGVWTIIRKLIYSEPEFNWFGRNLHVRESKIKLRRYKPFSFQNTAEWTLAGTAIILDIILIRVVVSRKVVINLLNWELIILSSLIMLLVIFQLYVTFRVVQIAIFNFRSKIKSNLNLIYYK